WGEERIAAELRLKLGLCVSPRTVRRYMPARGRPRDRVSSQRWSTFVRNHVGAMLACDFFVTITARFRTLYVFVVLDLATRRIVLNERHLRSVLQEWVAHYNQGRPHASLGPGIPDVPLDRLARPNGHHLPDSHRVVATPILAGLHHDYRLEGLAA